MRRAGLAAAALSLALAALGGDTSAAVAAGDAPAAGHAAGASLAGSAAPGCTPRRHTKRVVRHVRRHGRVRPVRRTRHWWTCDPAQPAPGGEAAPSGPVPAPSPSPEPTPAPTPTPEPEPEPDPSWLGVKAVEYGYTLSRQTLTAGEVTVELDNRGQDAHNLNLRPVGEEGAPLEIAETESLQRRRAEFTLQPGTYRLWCSLPTHDEEGMHATLVVAP